MASRRYTKADIEERKETLRGILKPGDTVVTVLRHVSRSGMYRAIDLYKLEGGGRRWLSSLAGPLLEGFDERHEACRASGCGMDMGFHLVYNLGYVLYPEWECTGDRCPSNAHLNARGCTCGHDWDEHERGEYRGGGHCKTCKCREFKRNDPHGAGVMHSGGYALRQEWL